MSDTLSKPINMVVQVTDTQLVPIESQDPLNSPTNNSANCQIVAGEPLLTYSCTIDIPVEVDFSEVKALQYYSGNLSTTLEFYFVYDYDGTLCGRNNQYDVVVIADNTNVPLVSILNVFSMIENIDPKTSRGTVTTVRIASE